MPDLSVPVSRPLDADSLRVVVLKETDQKLLFDSATVLPVPHDPKDRPSRGRLSPCGRFQV